jgi:hypothetical protein
MTEKMIRDAYCRIRTIDQTIPDEVLDFMRDASIEKLNQALRIHDVVGRSELLKAFADKWNIDNDIADSPIIHDGFIDEFLKSL